MKRIKVKASAIQYALLLSVMIAILLGGLVLFSGMSQNLNTQFHIQEKVRINALSGIEYGKAFLEEFEFNEPKEIRLFNEGVDSVQLTKKNWGAYAILISKAFHRRYSFQKIALIGHESKNEYGNLFLADLGSPLSVCGKTSLTGTCYLPKRGVKRAYIAGQNYIGNKLIYGEQRASKAQLPKLNESILSQIDFPLSVEKKAFENKDSIINSFTKSALFYYSNEPIYIDGLVKGQILIQSTDSIFVSKYAQLDGVILKSPIVYFEEGFLGNVQVFASHKVTLENNVVLTYPSVIGLIEKNPEEHVSHITLGENSKVLGSVFLTSLKPNFRKEVMLDLKQNSSISGLVYCNGKTQLKGEVNGCLLTKKFYLKTAASSYENHLLNAKISNDLPTDFVVVPLIKTETKNITLSWLE